MINNCVRFPTFIAVHCIDQLYVYMLSNQIYGIQIHIAISIIILQFTALITV